MPSQQSTFLSIEKVTPSRRYEKSSRDCAFFDHPAAEIEQVSSLFQEKQAELQSAVLRVEQLSLQLEDLRRGKLNGIQSSLGGQVTGAAALELRKLYQELQVLGQQMQN